MNDFYEKMIEAQSMASQALHDIKQDRLRVELRDYFAASVLHGLMVGGYALKDHAAYAEAAYKQADAMLAERERGAK